MSFTYTIKMAGGILIFCGDRILLEFSVILSILLFEKAYNKNEVVSWGILIHCEYRILWEW